MATSLKKRPTKSETTIESQIMEVRQQRLVVQSRIAELHHELESCASTPGDRQAHLDQMRAALAKAESDEAKQAEYSELLLGRSGQQALTELRERIKQLALHIEQVESLQAQYRAEIAAREAALRQELTKQEQAASALDARLQSCFTEKERLHDARGREILIEREALLVAAEANAREQRERAQQADSLESQAHADAFSDLEKWPALRRELASRHRPVDDATSEALQAAVTYADTLLRLGAAIGVQNAGAVTEEVWHELILNEQTMRLFGQGDSVFLQSVRDRQYSLLYAYRGKLSRT